MSKQDKIKEQIDEIRYEIEDFFDNGERRKDVYKYDDHKILAEIVEKKLSILFEDIRHEINIEVAGIAGILNGSAVGDTGQAHIAQMKLGKIVEVLDSLNKIKQ
jgi:hypothetical protein